MILPARKVEPDPKTLIHRFSICLISTPLISMLLLIMGLVFHAPFMIRDAGADQSKSCSIPDDSLDNILASTEKNLGQIKTLKTLLIQEKHLSLFAEPVISTGVFLFKAPGKIRLEFFEPFKSILMVSGSRLFKFEEFNGQWQKIPQGSEKMMEVVLDHIGAWVNGRFNQGDLYKITGKYRPDNLSPDNLGSDNLNPDSLDPDNLSPENLSKDQRAFSLILEPRAAEFKKFIQAFELGINSGMDRLDYIIIKESGEDYTKITFHQDLVNTPVEDVY
jgi:outer membrane lipoprotein-sorting protein